ncbi:MAG: error-prone DNA polymerase [Pseudomonadota bacterium]|nr:MAG: error-prone DNA polymerase [Pseudomonadota bacterium]
MPTLPDYAELHCISNFTFLRGASHPGELVARAAALGYRALALTDECSLAGVVRAHLAAQKHKLKLIIGSEIRLDDGPRLVFLATSRIGYGNLSELITEGRRNAAKGHYSLQRVHLAHGLPDCIALLLPDTDTRIEDIRWIAKLFPERAWLAMELHHGATDREHIQRLQALSLQSGLPLVAAGDAHMHRRNRRTLQDLLTAIRLGTTVKSAGHALFPSGERHLRSRARLARIYRTEWLQETLAIAARCQFSLDELRYEYPIDDVPAGQTASAYLRRLTEDGVRTRWPNGAPPQVCELVEHELAIIAELHYEPYFLTVYDLITFARQRGILCQGRGSAANSAVCYCLGITSVDPARMQMLFERFISKERNEPPDIDIDFEHERREEVLQYVYEKYGRQRAALAATVITYRRKSALRDTGKALGMNLQQVERLASAVAWWDEGVPDAQLREAGFDPGNPAIARLIELTGELHGFPRHLSQHVGGFVISHGPLAHLVPIENAAMADRTVIQWDKDDLDALGLLKVDCLGLGMLSAIHRAFDLVHTHRGRQLTLANVPPEDAAVYTMIQNADTVGVFQIESRAQMSMLPRLRPANFYDLVIEVAIVRPGPIQGQMVHPYLKRRQGLEPVTYPSDAVRDTLARTLGVPIFQEQVIKLAMVAAGFSAGEADHLRRAIGSWRHRDTLARFQARLIEGMRRRGYTEAFAQQIYQQIQGFGEYGFPESHAASFALLVYVSAWLKHYEPAAFACALLNSQPMGFYAPSQLLQDAQRHGVEVRPVDVNVSKWDCDLELIRSNTAQATKPHCENNNLALALRLGLRMVKGMSRAGAERLVEARRQDPFRHVQDLVQRAQLSKKDIDALATAGALASLAGNRHQARWQALGTEPSLPLFCNDAPNAATPMLPRPSEAQDLIADYGSLGLTLGRHPLALLRPRLDALYAVAAEQLQHLRDGCFVHLIGLVVTRQHPASAGGVIFITLEDETGSANIIVWQNITQRHRKEVLGAHLLGVKGKLQREGQVIHIVAAHLEDHSQLLGMLETQSRDFR